MGMLRRNGAVIVRLVGPVNEGPKTGTRLLPRRIRGKWRPLGAKYHVPSDPTITYLIGCLRNGKPILMDLARHAAATDLRILRLIENWDKLSAGAQRAVTLTDLCKFSDVTPARFIAPVARAACETGHSTVIMALSTLKQLPPHVELALREEFASRSKPEIAK